MLTLNILQHAWHMIYVQEQSSLVSPRNGIILSIITPVPTSVWLAQHHLTDFPYLINVAFINYLYVRGETETKEEKEWPRRCLGCEKLPSCFPNTMTWPSKGGGTALSKYSSYCFGNLHVYFSRDLIHISSDLNLQNYCLEIGIWCFLNTLACWLSTDLLMWQLLKG